LSKDNILKLDNSSLVCSEMVFHAANGIWVLKIADEGIVFNRDLFPRSTPDLFAECFVNILEKNYEVSFTKMEKAKDET